MIKLTNINKYYSSSEGKFHALTDINLLLPDQGMIYVTGKSGSGKSTLLNIIGGIDNYDSGEMIITNNYQGETQTIDTAKFSKKDYNAYRNTYVGFIFQEFNVVKGLTVYENIALSIELQKKSPKEYHEKILEILNKVGLSGKEKRRINELSGGERQRVAIARALIKDPKIIIADEPTGNLDSKNRDIVMDILKELSKEKLVLIVTHDRNLSEKYGDREIIIKDGKIIDDKILHPENISDVVPSDKKMDAISPKWIVPLNLAWKGFKLNKFRFIIVIILFSVSLLFAGMVFNLYLTNTTKKYSEFQQEYGNYVVSLSNQYNYQGIVSTSGFYSFNIDDLNEEFTDENGKGMVPFISMKIDHNINRSNKELSTDFFKPTIDHITIYNSDLELRENFRIIQEEILSSSYLTCFITDYLAAALIQYGYYTDVNNINDLLGQQLKLAGLSKAIYIQGILATNYNSFLTSSDFYTDVKKKVAFEDNLAIYNSLYVTKDTYSSIYTANNVNYFYDDIIFNLNNKLSSFENVKFAKTPASSKYIKGKAPEKPQKGETNQVAVSKGFVEQVLKMDVDSLTSLNESRPFIKLGGSSVPTNFYICGTRRVPMQLEFCITGVVDEKDVNGDDIIAIYTPQVSQHTLFSGIVNASFIQGGFLTIKINDDIETNSKIYRKLLDNGINIDNPSFIKLQLVDNFINDNIYLFAALFFVFCLFSILMIFNFIVINIKNSTRDIGIYMSLGMNGFKIALIYLFQVFMISTIAVVVGLIGETIFLKVMDNNFSNQALIDFAILKNTLIGISGVIILGYITPLIAIISPLFSLSKKKPVDVIKQS